MKTMLMDFQEQFIHELFAPVRDKSFLQTLSPAGRLKNSALALDVHKQGYFCAMIDALSSTYEMVWRVLGDDDFITLCRQYIEKNPSRSYNLNHYGRSFSTFLNTSKQVQDFPFLPELADFELDFSEVFHAASHTSITNQELAQIDCEPYGVLHFGDSIRVRKNSFSTYKLWQQKQQSSVSLSGLDQAEYLVLYRRNNIVFVRELEAEQHHLLDALFRGTSFGQYLDECLHDAKLKSESILDLFQFIAREGLVCRFERPCNN